MELRGCLVLLLFGIVGATNKICDFEGKLNLVENRTALLEQKAQEVESDLKNHLEVISKLTIHNAELENKISAFEENLARVENRIMQMEEKEKASRKEIEVKINQIEKMLSANVSIEGKTEDEIAAIDLEGKERYFDNSFILLSLPFGPPFPIRCYSNESYDKIDALRVPFPGQDISLKYVVPAYTMTDEKYSAFELPAYSSSERFGAFECKIEEENRTMEVFTLARSPYHWDTLRASNPYQVANIGDTVEFIVRVVKYMPLVPIRWWHNGVDISNGSGVLLKLQNVQPEDAGVYECFYRGSRGEGGVMRLIVRKCKANMYGENCDRTCPPCYNGGICHDTLGICVCPAGFTGSNCEFACDANHFGPDCSMRCRKPTDWVKDCRSVLLCRPDPYGCACASGYKGFKCNTVCEHGRYGADCKQRCHCANGPKFCNRVTGACIGGCSSGWRGNSCQIKD